MNYSQILGNAKFVTPSEPCSKRVEYTTYEGVTFPSADNCIVPYIRGEFSVGKKVKKAELYACGLGIVELYLNGSPVSDERFVPVISDYHYIENRYCFTEYGEHTSHRIYCLCYDVTHMLCEHNCIGAALSIGGYYSKVYGKIKLSFRLKIEFEDGTSDEILSGEWLKWHFSPITRSHFLFGESHDYNTYRLDGWNSVGYDASDWKSVEIAEGNGVTVLHYGRRLGFYVMVVNMLISVIILYYYRYPTLFSVLNGIGVGILHYRLVGEVAYPCRRFELRYA